MTEEIAKYKEFVKQLSDNNDGRVFLNSSSDHAVVVATQIFRRSHDMVRIFAKNLCRTIGNDPEYIAALSDFIERGGKVRILLNGYEESYAISSNLYKRLAYYKNLGKDIVIKTTDAKPYLTLDKDKKEVHFTVGDTTSYRIEMDIENRTAQCSMNNQQVAKVVADFFDAQFASDSTQVINLLNLFGYDE